MVDLQTHRKDKQALQAELVLAGATITSSGIKCPFHADDHPSAGVYENKADGVWRFKCQASSCNFLGDIFDVRARRTNTPLEQVLKEAGSPKPWAAALARKQNPRTYKDPEQLIAQLDGVEAVFKYTNPDTGMADLVVCRQVCNGHKTFKQISRQGDGYVLGAPPKPWPLYNRMRIQQTETVLVVEGEKCVHAAAEVGIIATTSPAGAGKADHADWTPLAGKTVILWPDNDDAGRNHMKDVANILLRLEPAPKISMVDPTAYSIEQKGDIADWIALCPEQDRAILTQAVIDDAKPYGLSSETAEKLRDIIAGKIIDVSWPWSTLTDRANALLPGTITLLCGDPGSGKSYFLLEAAIYWHRSGHKIALFELEDNREYHGRRIMAQVSQNSSLMKDKWVRNNGPLVEEIISVHDPFIKDISRYITDMPRNLVTYAGLLEWIEKEAKCGAKILAIDPITAVDVGKEPWNEDKHFIMAAKTIVADHGACLVIVTHPRKSRKSGAMSMDDLAGGAAFQRFAHCILWLEAWKDNQSVKVLTPVGSYEAEINRAIKFHKTRNSIGMGWRLGMYFDGTTFDFEERGLILDETKKKK